MTFDIQSFEETNRWGTIAEKGSLQVPWGTKEGKKSEKVGTLKKTLWVFQDLKRVSVTTTVSVCKSTTRATWALLFWHTWSASSVCKPTTFVITERGLRHLKVNPFLFRDISKSLMHSLGRIQPENYEAFCFHFRKSFDDLLLLEISTFQILPRELVVSKYAFIPYLAKIG